MIFFRWCFIDWKSLSFHWISDCTHWFKFRVHNLNKQHVPETKLILLHEKLLRSFNKTFVKITSANEYCCGDNFDCYNNLKCTTILMVTVTNNIVITILVCVGYINKFLVEATKSFSSCLDWVRWDPIFIKELLWLALIAYTYISARGREITNISEC